MSALSENDGCSPVSDYSQTSSLPSVEIEEQTKEWHVVDKAEIGERDIYEGEKLVCEGVPTFKVYIICDRHNASLRKPRGGK